MSNIEQKKRQKRQLLSKQKKLQAKENIANMKAGVAPIDVDDISAKIDVLTRSEKPLSETAKRRLRLLKKLKKIGKPDESPEENASENSSKNETKKSKQRRERRNKKEDNAVSDQIEQNKIWEEDTRITETRISKIFNKPATDKKVKPITAEEVSNDSDYEVEHIVKPDGKMEVTKDGNNSDLDIFEHGNKKKKASQRKNKVPIADDIEMDDIVIDTTNVIQDNSEANEADVNPDDNNDKVNGAVKNTKKPKNTKPKKQLKLLNKDDPENVDKPDKSPKLIKADQFVNKNAKGLIRYVLFIGNIPYDCTKNVLQEHFQKAGEIRDVRIPLEKGSNKPRGFAYLEMTNSEGYERALSLHHTTINGRRINVNYTQTGKKKPNERKNIVKEMNFKLDALRKKGVLAGSRKQGQKRRDRRNKQKN